MSKHVKSIVFAHLTIGHKSMGFYEQTRDGWGILEEMVEGWIVLIVMGDPISNLSSFEGRYEGLDACAWTPDIRRLLPLTLSCAALQR